LRMRWVRLGKLKSGATAVSQTVTLASAGPGWAPVSATVRRPAWADAGRLVVRVGPDTAVRLDDVRFEPLPAAGESRVVKLDAKGDTDAFVEATGSVDFARSATVLAVGAAPWARMPDGRVVGGPAAFEAAPP